MFDGVRAVLAAVEKQTGVRVELGTVPTNLLKHSLMGDSATNAPARDILARAFRDTGQELSWRLLYAPGDRPFYVFNVQVIKRR